MRLGGALGLAEGCVACHGDVAGLAGARAPRAIGCEDCHTKTPASVHADFVSAEARAGEDPRAGVARRRAHGHDAGGEPLVNVIVAEDGDARLLRERTGEARGTIDIFVPGMTMTCDRNREHGRPPIVLFRRLYAKLFSHTVRRESRPCVSCHADPVALGFGRGDLRYVVDGGSGRWRFAPAGTASPGAAVVRATIGAAADTRRGGRPRGPAPPAGGGLPFSFRE